MFVLDASLTLAWGFADEATPSTEDVLDRLGGDGALVPAIWPAEVANGLIIGERRGRVSQAQIAHFVDVLTHLPISVNTEGGLALVFGPVLSLAREQGVSVYDASYLDLALRRGLPLATLDSRLRAAATRLAVPLVGSD